jgi:hypothetical protein
MMRSFSLRERFSVAINMVASLEVAHMIPRDLIVEPLGAQATWKFYASWSTGSTKRLLGRAQCPLKSFWV